MPYLCRECTNKVEFKGGDVAYCPNCNKEMTAKETISSWSLDARMNQLRAMHELLSNANDENIYMSWIYLMPDGATEEDFQYIALDDASYNECFNLFVKLIQREGNRW